MTIGGKQLTTALQTHRQERSDDVTKGLNPPIQADYPDAASPADYRAELAAAKARIVAADEARRRIERDLHDGLQQRLVSVALEARHAEASVPADQQELKPNWRVSRTAWPRRWRTSGRSPVASIRRSCRSTASAPR